jgi:hypothetical protein
MRAEPDRQHATKVGDLVRTARGRDVLRAHGVHLDLANFVAALLPPAAMELGDGHPLVLSAQQPYLDYRRSVLAKVDLLLALRRRPDLATVFLWLDTDGASSDSLMTSVAWPARADGSAVRLVSHRRCAGVESRFLPIRRADLVRFGGEIGHDGLAALLDSLPDGFPLAEVACVLSADLFRRTRGCEPPPLQLSALLERDWLLTAVEELLEAVPLVIESFNRALARLRAEGIHPGLPARPSGYLPLFFACASDGRRLRLRRASEDGEQVALARCNACGVEYQFRLGRSGRSMAELAATGRWSPDLCWLLLLRERISGYVAGASSAVYGLVLQAVAKEVFSRPLPPVHVPEAITREMASATVDSLLHAACPPPPVAEEGVRWCLAG